MFKIIEMAVSKKMKQGAVISVISLIQSKKCNFSTA